MLSLTQKKKNKNFSKLCGLGTKCMDLKRFSRILKGKFRKNQNQSKNEKHGKRKKMRGNWLIRKEESGERHYFLSFYFF